MPHDPVLVRTTREWILRAADDLKLAEAHGTTEPAFIRDALFHCQQATEKALKAFLAWHDKPFRKTHDLRQLSDVCIQIDRLLAPLLDRTELISDYAWKFRYPGAPCEPSAEEVSEALQLAREIVEAIRSRLPAEVRQ